MKTITRREKQEVTTPPRRKCREVTRSDEAIEKHSPRDARSHLLQTDETQGVIFCKIDESHTRRHITRKDRPPLCCINRNDKKGAKIRAKKRG